MKDRKDEKLSELFGSLSASGRMPSERVTQPAKQLLEEEERVPEVVLVPAAVTAGGEAVGRVRRKRELTVLAAVFACAAVMLIVYLLTQIFYSSAGIVLDWSQLTNVTGGQTYQNKEFVPFVQQSEVVQYDEFGLNEESPYYEEYAGDVILYYVQYESYGTTVDLIIEIDGFLLDELTGYQEIENDYVAQDLILYIEMDEISERTYVYFAFDAYGYYMQIYTIDTDLLYLILEEVVFSF